MFRTHASGKDAETSRLKFVLKTIINKTLQLIKSLKLSAMPPLTRAGQSGRDDDQAAAGNGREEGWLMQVVKILQLANPALTAEEAIVQAMSLVNISNQAPRRETKKIPKGVSSSIELKFRVIDDDSSK
ncbi:uncharacterized protein UDID_17210 [Ustilago sp. UG-2017a]|nr:uncharacterized protein UDID_17210 [Ustilago sp. UG-2017a]